ncbi:TnpV protein [Clostridiaceae bacterium]|nr:TnpV protein [Clostridiaceae bacterium]
MHISYKPLWHTLIERNMRKEDLRLAAGLTTNMIANMGKEGKHISMDTLARICETLDCGIMDVIELVKTAEGVTEELKARNQLEWVGQMNNIRNRAEEIINSELIYI